MLRTTSANTVFIMINQNAGIACATVAVLSDLVVVDYSERSRNFLTSYITSINLEDMNFGAIKDVDCLLPGKIPGLNIATRWQSILKI